MNLQIVPARTGLHWAIQGVRTFWRQPLAMSGLFFLFMATVSVLSLVPFIGGAFALMALPALTLGMMAATQTAVEGKFPMPGILFSALKAGPQRKTMLHLGGWYAVLFLGVMLVSVLADGGTFAKVYFGGAAITPETVNAESFQVALWLSMVLYIPVSMMFWHAPALVYWHGLPAGKSLFFSLVACWRNLRAFSVYVLVWIGIFTGSGILALLIASLLGDPQLMMAILMPMALMVTAMFFTSMLFTVQSCFSPTAKPDDGPDTAQPMD
ncbi:BPSS1780 family membrane protein [Limnohabitans sp. T6-20]|uniref:BPSS1780 family membrane protein n=1 Tax=Limnohabitans sp. T6-20 TaxID=1100725 RepID=UPI000D34933D|nr:BPSS1780 family membrane protein [Limnohabitans sp. T6-20]PUE09888.1 hypothetical protein B9Z33_07050 [Limnohabitans sp. T6-20]